MKKIVSTVEMRKIEERAIIAETTQETLMDKAGEKIAHFIASFIEKNKLAKKAFLLAGKGNNGGDGYMAASLLLKQGFAIQAYQVLEPEIGSLCYKKRAEFLSLSGKMTEELPTNGVIIDAIFGIGFEGKTSGKTAEIIEKINCLKAIRIAIDIPSGLNANSGQALGSAIFAHHTLTIEFPKTGFFVHDGYNHIGKLHCLPIGLSADHISTELQYLEEKDVIPLLPKIKRNRHKYEAGHVVGLAGSHGMAGAAMLASLAAMKAGAGIVHLLVPENLLQEVAGGPWEIVRVPFHENDLSKVREWLLHAKACFIGPGLGTTKSTEHLLKSLWEDFKHKSILDADCLHYLSKSQKSFGPLPGSILTPHLGEMKRLLGDVKTEYTSPTFLRSCQHFVEENLTHLVLKGGPSFLLSPGKPITVMDRGDPGMATAGSGDVLTGILAALLAQGLTVHDALFLGPYLHGLAGEVAAEKETSYSMTATSIIAALPDAFHAMLSI